MAVAHIYFNHGSPHGALLHSGLQRMEGALADLNEIKGTMQLMIDGDGSNVAHFEYMKEKFNFTDTTAAKAAWDELNSMLFKLNTNDSVSSVNAALLQAFSKFR